MPKYIKKETFQKLLNQRLMTKEERETFRKAELEETKKLKSITPRKKRLYVIDRGRQGGSGMLPGRK
jgi:hypothetical protein